MGTVRLSTLMIYSEAVTPAPNGTTTIFNVSNAYVSGKLKVFMDGLGQLAGTDFSEVNDTSFQFVVAPATDNYIQVDYMKK